MESKIPEGTQSVSSSDAASNKSHQVFVKGLTSDLPKSPSEDNYSNAIFFNQEKASNDSDTEEQFMLYDEQPCNSDVEEINYAFTSG